MIRLLHLADVHLGARLSAFGDHASARRSAVLDAFRNLPAIVRERDVAAVLIAGDLFDSPDPPNEVRIAAAETIRRVVEGGVPVFVVPGNHDALTIHPNPYREGLGGAAIFREPVFKTESLEVDGRTLRVHGVAYDPAACRNPLETLPSLDDTTVDVVLLHASVRGPWEPGPNTLSVEEAELGALGADYIALGDHHRFRGPDGFATATTACYPGSFAAVDLTEEGPKGAVLVELGEPGGLRIEPIATGLPFVQAVAPVDVTPLQDHEEVLAAVLERVPDDVVPRVTLTGTPAFPLDPERIRMHLAERCGFAVVDDESRYYESGRIREIALEDTIAGHLARNARRRIDGAESARQQRVRERALRIALAAREVH